MRTRPSHRARNTSRRGSVYLLVLAAGVVLTSMGIAGLALLRVQRAAGERDDGAQRARLAAQSAMEAGVGVIAADPAGTSWRVAQNSGLLFSEMSIGDSTCSVTISDPGGRSLSLSPSGPVVLVARASQGGANQAISATFSPVGVALPVMKSALWAGGTLSLKGTLYADAGIGSNTSVIAAAGVVRADVTGPSISGTTYHGTNKIGASVVMPSPRLIDEWVARATSIPFAALPSGKIDKVVLAGGTNPFTTSVNSAGIYAIDCAGRDITICDARISGTLILLNPGPGSIITKSVLMEPYLRDYPALLVRGSIAISMNSSDLSESEAGVNFNPALAPYRASTDADQSDFYPSQISGITYVSGALTLRSSSTFEGVVLAGGAITMADTVTLRSRPPESVVAGFCEITGFKLSRSSLARKVD